jgi:hypothetical protein
MLRYFGQCFARTQRILYSGAYNEANLQLEVTILRGSYPLRKCFYNIRQKSVFLPCLTVEALR